MQRDYPLARLTTIRTGGPAELFGRPGHDPELEAMLAGPRRAGAPGRGRGSGSNLLVADEGVRGLVLKLDHQLARSTVDGNRMDCGGWRPPARGLGPGGARRPQSGSSSGSTPRHRRRRGADERQRLRRRTGPSAGLGRHNQRHRHGAPASGGARLRLPPLRPGAGEVWVARAAFMLRPGAPADQVKATLSDMRDRRREAQPSGIKSFGSAFKNPSTPPAPGRSAGQLLDAAGCRGCGRGRRVLGQACELR